MRLVARLDKMKQARVEGLVTCSPILFNAPVTFLVDTGCSNSCILPDDVIRLGIDHASLPTVMKTIVTANGPVSLKVLPNSEITLPVYAGLLDNKKGYLKVPLGNLPLLPPNSNFKPLPQSLVFSLLGMDVLYHFPRWIYRRDRLIMENDEVGPLKLTFKI